MHSQALRRNDYGDTLCYPSVLFAWLADYTAGHSPFQQHFQ